MSATFNDIIELINNFKGNVKWRAFLGRNGNVECNPEIMYKYEAEGKTIDGCGKKYIDAYEPELSKKIIEDHENIGKKIKELRICQIKTIPINLSSQDLSISEKDNKEVDYLARRPDDIRENEVWYKSDVLNAEGKQIWNVYPLEEFIRKNFGKLNSKEEIEEVKGYLKELYNKK